MILTIDWETKSAADLKSCGVFPYAVHPSTEMMCLSVKVDARPAMLWINQKFARMVDISQIRYEIIGAPRVAQLVEQADEIHAFNAQFEYVNWNDNAVPRLGWAPLSLEKLHDVQAQCAYCALPMHLGEAGKALGLSVQKDAEGHKVMMKLCRPRRPRKAEKDANPNWANTLYWNEDPADLIKLFNYCAKDADAEYHLGSVLPKLPDKERKIWLMDARINLRGVPVDVESVRAIIKVVGEREEKQLARFAELTSGVVSGPRSYVALKEWTLQNIPGLDFLESVDKNATAELLKRSDLSPTVREVLQIKSELSKSSVAKFRAMLNSMCVDERIRGMFSYHRASTGRWGGRSVQLHNMQRDSYTPTVFDLVMELFRCGDTDGMQVLYDDPYFVASRCVRGALCCKPGSRFICSDFSSIEAIVDAGMAGEESKLDVFRAGRCAYREAAAGIFNRPYEEIGKESDERQVGKAADLSMGFLGGIGAYAGMARVYHIDLELLPKFILPSATDEELKGQWGAIALAKSYVARTPDVMSVDAAIACDIIKRRWRARHPNIVRFGKALGEAAYRAVENPGQIFAIRAVKFVVHGGFLKCLLPSGRTLHYYNPRIQPVRKVWDEEDYEGDLSITYEGMRVVEGGATTRQWTRLATYSGKLLENCVQAVARDLLAEAMLRLEAAGYPIVLHVHDEAAAELPVGVGSLTEFNALMTQLPPWAAGWPVKVKGWEGPRYFKA